MEGFEDTPSVVGFLERAGWPGSISHAASTVEFFEDRGAFADVSLNFNVKATGVEPALGLTFHMKRRTAPTRRGGTTGDDGRPCWTVCANSVWLTHKRRRRWPAGRTPG